MINVLKRRGPRGNGDARTGIAGDPAARFAHDLATRPPTKNVASVKAASDVFVANVPTDPDDGRTDRGRSLTDRSRSAPRKS